MVPKADNPFSTLEKIFHEPNRLAIMSAVCAGGADGVTFNEIKDICDLTDGNLSRHLKTLEDAGMVRIKKEFVGVKPRTTAHPTESGVACFIEYLNNLEEVLETAARAAAGQKKRAGKAAALPKLNVRPAQT